MPHVDVTVPAIEPVPASRIRAIADLPVADGQRYVLYWMIASRRLEDNFALQRAAWWAATLDLPLLVFEGVRSDYPWASDRLHTCIVEGMVDNAADAARVGVTYLAYVEPSPGADRGLLEALASSAAVVVTDDYPTFFLPRLVEAAGRSIGRRLEAVDGNGLVPMRATATVYPTAYSFRRYLQKTLPAQLDHVPMRQPLAALPRRAAIVNPDVFARWPMFDAVDAASVGPLVAGLPIDHRVGASDIRGGARAAQRRLEVFLRSGLPGYREHRSHPDRDVASGLSPYLHFGHIGVHRIFAEVMTQDGWTRRRLSPRASGQREGWWNAGPSVEAFLDELITWREVGFNCCAGRADHDQYTSLPDWARASLDAHAADPREHLYTLDAFAGAATHDEVWNAAQRQLVREGRMQNYLRMLWGKKILEWSPTPQEALTTMIELNNRYALDGRDPNSYSGIFWVLGRYDRPWGPRRPVYGVIRYMSSANTVRKLEMTRYLATYGAAATPTLFS